MRLGLLAGPLPVAALALVLSVAGAACDDADPEETGECGPGETFCPGDGCINTAHDAENCGACGASCDGCDRCLRGVCEPTCCEDESNCGTAALPLCVHLPTDVDNCGACGTECAEEERCANGMCLQ